MRAMVTVVLVGCTLLIGVSGAHGSGGAISGVHYVPVNTAAWTGGNAVAVQWQHWLSDWFCLGVGADVAAPVMRIFGGHLKDRYDPQARGEARQYVLDALREVVEVAENRGVVLALENHGGMPCTGEEQVAVIQEVASEHLRATVDVGNYMSCGQEGHVGTQIAAPFAAYVHFKDFHKVIDERALWGWQTRPATVGGGDVDLPACLAALKAAGFDGFVALEYEGTDDETVGVPQSVEFMNQVMAGF